MTGQPVSPQGRTPAAFTYRDEEALTRHLVGVLEDRLAGRRDPRIINKPPADQCHLGVLGPWDPNVEQPELLMQEEDDEGEETQEPLPQQAEEQPRELDDDDVEEEDEAPESQTTEQREHVRRSPSSLGFEIVVSPSGETPAELEVSASFAVYTRHFPTLQEQLQSRGGMDLETGTAIDDSDTPSGEERFTLAEVCERHIVDVPGISFTLRSSQRAYTMHDEGRVQATLDALLDAASQRDDCLREFPRTPDVPSAALNNEDSFNRYLTGLAAGHEVVRPALRAQLDLRVEPWGEGRVRVGCYLRNDTRRDELRRYLDYYHILADAKLTAHLSDGTIVPIEILPIAEDYQFDRRVWGVGHGTSVVVEDDSVRTESLARYEQPRQTTTREPSATFDELIHDPLGTLERIHSAMGDYAANWESQVVGQNTRDLDEAALAQCRLDLENFRDEQRRFAAGMAALLADERLRTAFVAMNRVFRRIAQGRYDRWHIFQIVFIVTQLPALAIREGVHAGRWPQDVEHEWDDALEWVDVLWFPTGGGKTEAYLGLVSCAALFDRLRAKRFGMTAWLRFPLRMLSVQQLQRAIKVVWETENERQSMLEDPEDSDPISLGYFVGSNSTPNTLRREVLERLRDPDQLERIKVVSDCPACGGIGQVQVNVDEEALRLRHICQSCDSQLPLYVTDEEIYRYLPTFLVGTIDKMATLGYQPRFARLWGATEWRCPLHGYGMGQYCVWRCPTNRGEGGGRSGVMRQQVAPHDPSPSLHVQDELHLLQEELGAFAGHYETLLKYCEQEVGGLPPKIVAATATIEGFEHQVRHVYGAREARRFPGRGYDRHSSFFSAVDMDPQDPAQRKTARVYVAFRPPQLHSADAASLCTRILLDEVKQLYENPHDAAAFLPIARTDDQVRELLLYYTTTLTYVGTIPHGTRIQQDLHRFAGSMRPGNVRDLSVELHSGKSTLAELSDVIHRLEAPPAWEDESFLDAVVATDVISHGVDVERLNLMVLANIPEETARYIQAASRSGRQHVGMVVAVLASYSLRASSIYHRFREFHNHLERLVSPVPVNRFAKFAVQRTAPGVMVGLLYGNFGPRIRSDQMYRRHRAAQFLGLSPGTGYSGQQIDREQFLVAVQHAYGIGDGIYPESLELALSEAIEEEMDRFLYTVRSSRDESLIDAVRPKPMTSLRDVEAGVQFWPENVDFETLMWFRGGRR